MPHRAVEAIRGKADRWNLLLKHMKSFRRAFSGSNRSPDAFGKGYFSWRVGKQSECKPCDVAGAYTVRRTIHIAPVKQRLCSKNSVNATSVTKSEISRFRSRRPLPPDPYCSAPTQPPPLAAAWPWQVIGKNAKLNRRRDTFVSEISEFRHRRRD